MNKLRILLFPISVIYFLVVNIRNKFYDWGWFKSYGFDVPVIVVGNLMVGGAGKSPMAEYLVRLLKDDYKIAILSRGYGRNTRGFLEVSIHSSAEETGDEPLQFKKKFEDVTVAVCEGRVKGINILMKKCNLVILDDAYQHRAVKAGLNLLLFDYPRLHHLKLVLPAGDLREPLSGIKRADAIIITKIPDDTCRVDLEKNITHALKPENKPVFYSSLKYGNLRAAFHPEDKITLCNETTVFLLTGIANSQPLVQFLNEKTGSVIHHRYADHHQYTTKNIVKLAEGFKSNPAIKKIVVTTEKDLQRLQLPQLKTILTGLPLFYLPVEAEFRFDGKNGFDQLIKKYVTQYTSNH